MSNQSNIIGIDKLEIYNLTLVSLALGVVIAHRNCRITYSDTPTPISLGLDKYVKSIIVNDGKLFHSLTIICGYGTNQINIAIILTVSAARDSNLNPMRWAEYNEHLLHVLAYTTEVYGIMLDASFAKVRAIEITSNLAVSSPYADYAQCLCLLMSYLPANLHYGAFCNVKDKHLFGSIYRENKTKQIIVYDKLRQLRMNNPSGCLIRLEIRINSRSKHDAIVQALGTNVWADINDVILANYYYSYYARHFIRTYSDWKRQREKDLCRVMKKLYKSYPRQWRLELMKYINRKTIETGVPYILDISQVDDIARSFLKLQKDRNASRKIKLLHDMVDDGNKAGLDSVEFLCQDNLKKIAEIFEQLEDNYHASLSDASANETITNETNSEESKGNHDTDSQKRI